MNPAKVALVSRNISELFDFGSSLARIVSICEEQKANVILYSLWSYSHTNRPLQHEDLFDQTRGVDTVILESCALPTKSDCRTLVWSKNQTQPKALCQTFARASESERAKQSFMSQFGTRQFGRYFVIICGETNILKVRMSDHGVLDEYGLLEILDRSGVSVILNPVHDYMKRHEMKKKRAGLSRNKRWVLSVWNKGKKGETFTPWTAFYDGAEVTDSITEVPVGIPSVRMGVITVA